MTTPAGSTSRVLVILDPEYGERLQPAWEGQPIWVELSPINEPVVRELWRGVPAPNHLTGITGLTFDPSLSAEDRLLAKLYTIDLHHGPYSTTRPYTELEVIGCPLSDRIRTALSELGFTNFEEKNHGFLADRTPEEAAITR